jgi:hypothetical protein
LQQYTNWRQTWSHVVPDFWTASPFSGVLLYDPIAGHVEIYDTDGGGNISVSPIAQRATGSTWTHLVPGWFHPINHICTHYNSVLFYSQLTGTAELWATDGVGGGQRGLT